MCTEKRIFDYAQFFRCIWINMETLHCAGF